MASTKAAERDKKMLALLRGWKALEGHTIRNCSAIIKKTRNPIIKTLTTSIRNDSEKHRAILQMVIDGMTKKGHVLTSDELAKVSALLDKHITIEQRSIDTAKKAIEMSRDPIAKQMLRIILEDEKNHKKLAVQMNELKFRVTARVT